MSSNGTLSPQAPFDIWATSNSSYYKIQNGNISSAAFGMIFIWSCSTVYKSWVYYQFKPKLIYGLNVLQAFFMFVKTAAALIYTVFLGISCEPRGILMTVPLVLSLDCSYTIMLIKLLLFTPFRWASRGFFLLALLAHAIVTFIGVAQRTSKLSYGVCKDTYSPIFKQQYVIEIILECYTALALLHGLAIKTHGSGGMVSTTATLLGHLKKNEHLRVFSVLLLIALKLILTYMNSVAPSFDYTFVTHIVDQGRSAVVCWALMRDYRKLVKSSGTNSGSKAGAESSSKVTSSAAGKAANMATIQRTPGMGISKSASSGQLQSPGIGSRAPIASKVIDIHDPIFEDEEPAGKPLAKSDLGNSTRNADGVPVDVEAMVKSTETIAGNENSPQ